MGKKVKSNIEFIFPITFFFLFQKIFNSINENVKRKWTKRKNFEEKKIYSLFHVVKSSFIPFKLLAIHEVV